MNNLLAIDFCLCGNSYYYMDLGSLFSHFDKQEQQGYIIRGYKSIIDEQIDAKYIEAFMAFQIVFNSLIAYNGKLSSQSSFL